METRLNYQRAHFDFDALGSLTSPRRALGLEAVALGLIKLQAGAGYSFTHHHAAQEEVYIVIEGAGEMVVDGELLGLARGDVVRVPAPARRALRAAEDSSLFAICAGATPAGFPRDPKARYLIDDGVPHYDDLPPWCADDPEAEARNAELAARAERAAARRRAE